MPTKIEWADYTWNPITGCTKISPACVNCYAEKMAKRLKGRHGYPEDDPFKVTLHPVKLAVPDWWGYKPKRIFTVSMGDLFHDDVPFDWIVKVSQAIWDQGKQHGHKFLLLTKRPQRAAEFFRKYPYSAYPNNPHYWLGVTVENGDYLCRVEELLKIPAAKRFVSIEPMLGPIGLMKFLPLAQSDIRGAVYSPVGGPFLDWVICGGETGAGERTRAMHPDWVRSIRDQCQASGVPFFFKGWGSWIPMSTISGKQQLPFGTYDPATKAAYLWRKGQKRILDGHEWNEIPT